MQSGRHSFYCTLELSFPHDNLSAIPPATKVAGFLASFYEKLPGAEILLNAVSHGTSSSSTVPNDLIDRTPSRRSSSFHEARKKITQTSPRPSTVPDAPTSEGEPFPSGSFPRQEVVRRQNGNERGAGPDDLHAHPVSGLKEIVEPAQKAAREIRGPLPEVVFLLDDQKDLVDDGLVGDEFEDSVAVTGELHVGVANDLSAVFGEEIRAISQNW